jgi:hypothetical protein
MQLAMVTMWAMNMSDLISLCQDEGVTATAWVIAAMGIGMLAVLCPLSIKFLQKLLSNSEAGKIWKVSSTWLLITSGLLPAALFLYIAHYLGQDFRDCVSGQGFFLGLFVAWVSYLIAVVLFHLLSPWRREMIGR